MYIVIAIYVNDYLLLFSLGTVIHIYGQDVMIDLLSICISTDVLNVNCVIIVLNRCFK